MTHKESDAASGWREAAMSEALRVEADNGEAMDALVREVRRERSGCATLLLWADRLQLMRFLRERNLNPQSLLPGQDGHIERDEICPYLGWFAVEWQGETIEIVLTPGTYISAPVVGIGQDIHRLHSLFQALEEYALRPAKRCLLYSMHWESSPELDGEIGKVTWDDVILHPDIIARVREAVEGFYQYKEAFQTLGFPWRRGLLLIGPPGTGKTMLCKAAAAALPDLPFLYVRDFQTEGDHQDAITAIFTRARKLAPCLLAFEDIDGLVNDYNRTIFLNELDGFKNNDGLLIIASSNHPDRIDEALLKRPSRFDRVLHIGLPALAERRAYCLRLLSRSELTERLDPSLDIQELSQKVAEKSNEFTPAYLKEAFIAAALKQAQEGKLILDADFAKAVLAQVDELKRQFRALRDPDALRDYRSPDTEPMGIRRQR